MTFRPEVGRTYRIRVPYPDRPVDFLTDAPGLKWVNVGLSMLQLCGDDGVGIVATSTDRRLGGEPAVEGQAMDLLSFEMPLTAHALATLDLPVAGQPYTLRGVVHDASGTYFATPRPSQRRWLVPWRWLLPLP